MDFRIGEGWDTHALVAGRKLILGGVEIPHTLGLLGHSDADALLHAITDAVLGAAGLGDIGRHFPDTDERFKGADSSVLLGEAMRRVREQGWEVLIPSIAFKNSNSSFFGQQPFRLLLPDLDGLYAHIEDFIACHRVRLLNGAPDPGTFFVKTTKRTSRDASYSQASFYEAWRLIIQRYGIYNPYTGRGAIRGLLPHGPHNVRDVLATHVLKRTGSYEQASYAIQDTPEMVARHYGRFLPQHKAALAAKVLNEVWKTEP